MRFIILEDNDDRRRVMQAVLADRFRQYSVEFFQAVPPMIERLEATGLYDVALVSLDHDLDIIVASDGTRIDPGTGVDAAVWFAKQPAVAPVIVHTTNTFAGDRMMELLVQSGWNCHRIVPYGGEDWIGERWLPMVRKSVVAHGPNVGMAAFGLQILKSQWRMGNTVDRLISECIRAARCLLAGPSASDAISIQFLYLDSRDRLAPLIPEGGVVDSLSFGNLSEEFQGEVIDTGPKAVEDLQVSPEFREALKRLKVREAQFDVIRVPTSEPMQALMVSASLSERYPLDSHRTQSTLADLRSLVEVAVMFEVRGRPIADPVLTQRKKNH